MSPRTGRKLHWLGAFLWTAQAVAVFLLMWPPDWKMYLVEISLAANIISHLSGVSAERPSETVD